MKTHYKARIRKTEIAAAKTIISNVDYQVLKQSLKQSNFGLFPLLDSLELAGVPDSVKIEALVEALSDIVAEAVDKGELDSKTEITGFGSVFVLIARFLRRFDEASSNPADDGWTLVFPGSKDDLAIKYFVDYNPSMIERKYLSDKEVADFIGSQKVG